MKENINKIINKACFLWNVSQEAFLGRRKDMPLPFARSMVAKTIRDVYGLSYTEIGRILNRNHSSISYYYKMYDAEYQYNQGFRNFANVLKEMALDIRTEFQEELEQELNEIIG